MKRLGWLGCCVATFVIAGPAVALAAPPATLTGENFFVGGSGGGLCGGTGSFSFEQSGAASGPYSGTFTETGSFTITGLQVTAFGASFTIFSAAHEVLVEGTTAFDPTAFNDGCALPPSQHYLADLWPTYVATIFTPTGNYRDQGRSLVSLGAQASGSPNFFIENFTSSLTAPVLLVPTTEAQCKKRGWRNYPQFKNQAACVRFVVTG
jgi:hypothetical protein